jgi:hypothetical protein
MFASLLWGAKVDAERPLGELGEGGASSVAQREWRCVSMGQSRHCRLQQRRVVRELPSVLVQGATSSVTDRVGA